MRAEEEPTSKRIKTEEDSSQAAPKGSSTTSRRSEYGVPKPSDESVQAEVVESSNQHVDQTAISPIEEKEEVVTAPDVQLSTSLHHFHENCPHRSEPPSQCETIFCENCICYVCDINPSHCPSWLSAHYCATQSSEYWTSQRQEHLERQAWFASPTIDLYEQGCAYDEGSRTRARNAYFFYKNKSDFNLALKCYNLSSTQIKYISGYACPQARFEYIRETAQNSHHKKPCACCAKHFAMGTPYFVNQKANPFRGVIKYCLGCMGRIVAFHVSPDPSQIPGKIAQEEARIEELWKVCEKKAKKHLAGR